MEYVREFKAKKGYFDFRLSVTSLDITFWINDNDELYIDTKKREGVQSREVLWTNNPLLIKAFRELFELKWKSGIE